MKFLDDMKFVTDDNQEYFIAEKLIEEGELYCIAINLNNNADVLYVHADNETGELVLKNIEDENIINKLRNKFFN